jgi:hypothetical protein
MTERPKMDFGEAERAAIAADDILPPDPNPPGPGQKGAKPAKGVLVATNGDTRLMTPGRQAFLEGRNPRAIRRRIMARIRGLSDGAAETLEKLMNDPRDTRVQLQATLAVMSYTAGKPGENVSEGEGIDASAQLDMATAMQHLSIEECDRLNDALKVVAEMQALAMERMSRA